MTDRKRKITITEATSAWEAVMFMFSGYAYFWMHGWKMRIGVALVTFFAIAGVFVGGFQYYQARVNSVDFQDATPIKPKKISMNFSLMSEARAAEFAKGDSIIWDGDFWGMKDTDFEVFKVSGESIILIHDKVTHQTTQMNVPALQGQINKMRQK